MKVRDLIEELQRTEKDYGNLPINSAEGGKMNLRIKNDDLVIIGAVDLG